MPWLLFVPLVPMVGPGDDVDAMEKKTMVFLHPQHLTTNLQKCLHTSSPLDYLYNMYKY
jgi:hypothetical protein